MNGPDTTEDRIESALRRLPQWQPPADFATRMAAAAARQQAASVEQLSPQLLHAGAVLARSTDIVLLTLLIGAAATGLSRLPWQQLVEYPVVLACVTIAGALAGGLGLSLRLPRS